MRRWSDGADQHYQTFKLVGGCFQVYITHSLFFCKPLRNTSYWCNVIYYWQLHFSFVTIACVFSEHPQLTSGRLALMFTSRTWWPNLKRATPESPTAACVCAGKHTDTMPSYERVSWVMTYIMMHTIYVCCWGRTSISSCWFCLVKAGTITLYICECRQ